MTSAAAQDFVLLLLFHPVLLDKGFRSFHILYENEELLLETR